LPPQFERLAARVLREGCRYESDEVALKDACAAASSPGWRGRGTSRRMPRQRSTSRIRALVAGDALLEGLKECRLRCWVVLWDEYRKLHDLLVKLAGSDELLRRLCGIPGVGLVTAVRRSTIRDGSPSRRPSAHISA
jgi:hypothetical protein